MAELDTLITRLYEDRVNSKIPEKHYDRMMAQYDTEQSELESKIAEMKAGIDRFNADGERADKFMDLVQKYTEFDELSAELLNNFVERVVVHEAVKTDKKRTQEVEIYFAFIGGFRVPEDYDEYSPEERAVMETERERLDKKNSYENERRRKKRAERKAAKAADEIIVIDTDDSTTKPAA